MKEQTRHTHTHKNFLHRGKKNWRLAKEFHLNNVDNSRDHKDLRRRKQVFLKENLTTKPKHFNTEISELSH